MLQKISDRLFMVFTEQGFTYSNCFLVEDDIRLLIDSGAGDALAEIHPEAIDILVNSHHHIDHIRGNDLFPHARILAHPLEHSYYESPEKLSAISGWDELMEVNPLEAPVTQKVKPEEVTKIWRVDGAFRDEEVIDCGATRMIVYHTPGHTDGHCSFFFPDREVLFTGDICLTKVGPWYGEPNASIESFLSSIQRVIDLKPSVVVTGHVDHVVTENIEASMLEYRDRILKREQRILAYLTQHAVNIHQLADQHLIYKLHPSSFVLYWEKTNLLKHLDRLIQLGQVERVEEGRYRARV